MRHALLLAFRYLAYYRLRTMILLVCVSLTISLPVAVHWLVGHYHRAMLERAESTPLALGAPGSPTDLVLNALYFKGRLPHRLTMNDVEKIRDWGSAVAVPLNLCCSASNVPLVGTSLDYFVYRGLRVAEGALPGILGEIVLGAAAARRLGLSVGDWLLSDYERIYDISASYPLRLKVVGILAPSNTVDDDVFFVDIRTAWIIEGTGHGHRDARTVSDPAEMLGVTGRNLIMSGAVIHFNEINPENLDGYHFHGNPGKFPVSAILVFPDDPKSGTILKARYRDSSTVQLVVPRRVVEQMMDIVLRVRRFFDLNFAVVAGSTSLLLVLVILLSLRIRQREFQTLHKIGCSRSTVLTLQATEVFLLLLLSLLLAMIFVAGWLWYAAQFDLLSAR